MSIALSTLLERLRTDVPTSDDAPTDPQYVRAIQEAIANFNNRATRVKAATISVVSGTAEYALPADFVKLIGFAPLAQPGSRLLITETGLIPLSHAFEEIVTIEGDQLVIDPTPTYALERRLKYGAGHIETTVDGAQVYAEMGEREAEIILMLAKSLAWETIANAMAGTVTKTTLGDASFTYADPAASAQGKADDLHGKYEAAVARYIGTVLR